MQCEAEQTEEDERSVTITPSCATKSPSLQRYPTRGLPTVRPFVLFFFFFMLSDWLNLRNIDLPRHPCALLKDQKLLQRNGLDQGMHCHYRLRGPSHSFH